MIPGKEKLDTKTLESVSRTILTPPRESIDPRSYYSNISRQLLDIMTEEDTVKATFSAFICVQLLNKVPEEMMLKPILEPFTKLIWSTDLTQDLDSLSLDTSSAYTDLDGCPIIASEEQLQISVIQLQFLLLETKAETYFMKTIYPGMLSNIFLLLLCQSNTNSVIRPLFFIYQHIFKSASGMKASVSDIMTMVFRVAEESVALEYLKDLVMHPIEKTNKLINGSSGGVAISMVKTPIE
jgi:hypothetical protein